MHKSMKTSIYLQHHFIMFSIYSFTIKASSFSPQLQLTPLSIFALILILIQPFVDIHQKL